ncbi:hypothetical protein HWQ46_23530 [Shewanella sp. D64]|uniref:hypothetical protein n=1 Tax=unclassified Shewanella TaxID=196818 RepID=UPI0022BA13FF|nr:MULTISPECIES: hypothetical protein [unclassified Shewanella]MEC4728498.1 hypothetical protein [Shewanella sp. D64]MEC4740470.1 hypothetical protein [Shewanella sp. E94]WBJ95137.1 hypothetical protein HWQ47_25565 [Shewanella sp. MTB7]
MSTNVMNKLSSEYVLNVKDSNYEFNRFDKAALRGVVSVLKLLVNTVSYSNWRKSALIFDAVVERYSSSGSDVYCFIASPVWKTDTRIVRHYGLGRALSKDFRLGPLNFLFEKEIVNDHDVIFYGVVKLTSANAGSIFNLLSTSESGVLFSSLGPNDSNFSLLVKDLAMLVAAKPKSLTFNLNIVKAINLILDRDSEALFPYAWEETGEYHLDIFRIQDIH